MQGYTQFGIKDERGKKGGYVSRVLQRKRGEVKTHDTLMKSFIWAV